MKRAGKSLSYISIVFILLNLLSPLSVNYAAAQSSKPLEAPVTQTTGDETTQSPDDGTTGNTGEQNTQGSEGDTGGTTDGNTQQGDTGGTTDGNTQQGDTGGTTDGNTQAPVQPTPVTPELPQQVTNGYCADDGVTHVEPVVVAALDTAEITYQVTPPDASGAFSVTATLNTPDANTWSDATTQNWVINDNNVAVYSSTVSDTPCPPPIDKPAEQTDDQVADPADKTESDTGQADLVKVSPEAPTIEDGVCKDGEAVAPTVTPAETEGLTYDLVGPDEEGAFTLTATLAEDYTWADSFNDWVPDGNVATYVKNSVPIADCQTKPSLRMAATSNGNPDAAQYTIQKSVDPSTVAQGMNITYTIVVGWGPEVANTPFTITDTIPAPLTNANSSGCFAVVPDGAVDCSGGGSGPAGTVMTWNIDPHGYTGTVYINITAYVPEDTAGQKVTNYAYVGDPSNNIVAANTFTILNKLPENDTTNPVKPGITQGQCVGGEIIPPTLTFPQTSGIEYTIEGGTVGPGNTVSLQAKLKPGYEWEQPDPSDWPINGWNFVNATTASRTVKFDKVECKDATPNPGTPTAGVCIDGEAKDPTYKLPSNSKSVHYSNLTSTPNNGSVTFTFTATLQNGYAWTDSSGWPADDGEWMNVTATQATYSITLEKAECKPVTLAKPDVTTGVCNDGVYTEPTIKGIAKDGITYSVNGPDSNGDFTVTATLSGTQSWADPIGGGWNRASNTTATYEGNVDLNTCTDTVPKTPTVSGNVCKDGVLTPPTINLANKPNGVTYELTKPVDANGKYTVTATLSGSQSWGSMPDDWDVTSPTVATYKGELTLAECTPVTPVTPVANDATCDDGIYVEPTLTPGNGGAIDGITYSWDPGTLPNGGTVTITATLDDGHSWTDLTGSDWTPVEGSATQATYTATFTKTNCDTVKPVTPTANQAVCETGGKITPPTLTPGNGDEIDGITYTYDTSKVKNNGGDVVITATLAGGKVWSSDLGEGWSRVEGSTTQATYTVHFENIQCGTVTPAKPGVTKGVCQAGGEITDPIITGLNDSDNITYSWDASKVVNGGSVEVTATLHGNNEWPINMNGWEKTSTTTATRTVNFPNVECGKVSPAEPGVTDAVCQAGGEITDPIITGLNDSDNITYSWNEDDVTNGGSVTITATLKGANVWGDLNGWDLKSDTTATYTIDFTDVKCDTTLPVQPLIGDAVCLAGGTIQPPALAVGPTDGIKYTWDGSKVVNGGTVVVTATLQTGYVWEGAMPYGWSQAEGSSTEATYTVKFDDVNCEEAIPVAPAVNEAVCTDGVVTTPSYEKPTTPGITYTYSNENLVAGGSVDVTATLQKGYEWGSLPDGWTAVNGSTTKATYKVTFRDTTCTDVELAEPNVKQAVCTDGELKAPTVSIDETTGVTYTISPDSFAPGTKVVITATVQDNYGWPTDLPGNWKKVDAKTATNTFTLDQVECEQVIPAAPTVNQVVCTDGELTTPSVTPQETDGIDYTMQGDVVNGGTVVVTATLQKGKAWGDMPDGWTRVNSTTATYTVELDDVNCIEATPVAPKVVDTVCVDGGLTEPSVTPAQTDGIVYAMKGDVVNGGTVVVTATIQDNYGWDEMPDGWTRINSTTATYTVELDDVNCTETVPVTPKVVNTVCVEGGLTTPSVTPVETEGIVYSFNEDDVVNGGTVVVTATLQDDYAWPADAPTPLAFGALDLSWPANWTRVDATTATFTVQLDDVSCTDTVPVAPKVVNTVCVEGGLTDPSVTPAETEGVTYTMEGDVVNGGTVVITATIQDDYAWGTMPDGWTKVDNATATYTVELDEVECTPTQPIAPEVTNAVCTDGTLTDPSLNFVKTDGVGYGIVDPIVNGGTVVVTATIEDGHAWGEMPEGWTKVDNATATYTVKFDDVECTPVTPEKPVVTNAVCTEGGLSLPTLETAKTDGITYSFDSENVVNGGMVTVTATLADGYGWDTMPDGWTMVDSATATFVVEFDDVECTQVVPENPAVTNAVCTAGELTAPTLETAKTDGITYSFDSENVVNGGKATVIATLDDGYAWGEMPDGWTMVDSVTAIFTVQFDNVECPPVTPEPTGTPKTTPVTHPTETAEASPVTTLPVTGSGETDATNSMAILMLTTGAVALAAVALGIRRRMAED